MIIKDGAQCIVNVPQELTIRTVEAFHDKVKNAFVECEGALVNLIGVVEIDTAGFQMLVALKKEILQQKKTFSIVGMSTEVDEIISLYGAEKFFQ